MTKSKNIRCIICDSLFCEEDLVGKYGCPGCETKVIPCDTKEDVSININLHELRILTIWAENWANYCDNTPPALDDPSHTSLSKTVDCINNRLHKQLKLINKDTCLTIREEINNLKENNVDAKLYRNGKEDVEF